MKFIIDTVNKLVAFANRIPVCIFELTMRIAVGNVFWRSGHVKIASWESTVGLFRDEYKVPLLPPEIAAKMATVCELGMPVFLVLGLGTRFAAAVLFGMTAVIQLFVYPDTWPDNILWASILGYLIARGAGALSLDYLIAKKFGQK
jgi:putative oxidoreductase